MDNWQTIKLKSDTKQLLDNLRSNYGTYDNAIKRLLNPVTPYVLSLTKTIPAATWAEKKDNYKEAPFMANVLSCNIYTPSGCQDLVLIRIGIGDQALSDWITSGDGKSLSIPINKIVRRGELIWAEIQNLDTTYEHTPTIEFILVPIEAKVSV
jgi:hypothetical protein